MLAPLVGHKAKHTVTLTDSYIDTVIDYLGESATLPGGKEVEMPSAYLLRDTKVPGLQIRVGKRAVQWQFYRPKRDHGKRSYHYDAIGHYDRGVSLSGQVERGPKHVSTEAAREKAMAIGGRLSEGSAPVSKRAGTKFGEAFEAYIGYLERKAAERGKPPRWADRVRSLGNLYMLPKWANWTLSEMSERPDAVADWHLTVKSAVSANHCARIIRALYKQQAKRSVGRSLNMAHMPTSAVEMRRQRNRQTGIGKKAGIDFTTWYAAWKKVRNPQRKAFYLVGLLTGTRPGELARCRWRDFDAKAHVLAIGGDEGPKVENILTYEIPTTPEIEAALKLAKSDYVIKYKEHGRTHEKPRKAKYGPDDLIFPGCGFIQARDRKELPVMGHGLRRTFETVASDHCGVSEQHYEYLEGRPPPGIQARYLLKWARVNGPVIVEAQHEISRTMMALLQGRAIKPAAKRKPTGRLKRAA
jgi:integrase